MSLLTDALAALMRTTDQPSAQQIEDAIAQAAQGGAPAQAGYTALADLQTRLDALAARMDAIEQAATALQACVTELEASVPKIEERTAALEAGPLGTTTGAPTPPPPAAGGSPKVHELTAEAAVFFTRSINHT